MYNLEFTSEELILLQTILNKNIQSNHVTFTQNEMESMEKILLSELHKNFDIWIDLFEEQQNQFPFMKKPTEKMTKQWKYTGIIEEIYNRIATPIGKSKRASLEELEKCL